MESVDVSCHHSVDTWVEVGFGRPVEDPAVPGMLEKYTRVFEDAVRLMADCFDVELDEVRFECELGACTKDVDLGWYQLGRGHRSAAATSSTSARRRACPAIEMHLEWQMTPHTDPHWDIQGCYITKIEGDPWI